MFSEWEADFGRTFVLGNNETKKKIRDDLEPVWYTVKSQFDKKPDMTGEELYSIACAEAKQAGWEFGGPHSGHLVGDYPHERIPNDKITFYITEGNKSEYPVDVVVEPILGLITLYALDSMRSVDQNGHNRHWILEIHLVDRERKIGGFYEQLLTVG